MIPTLLWLFNTLIDLYTWVIILMVIMSWLTAFNVLNPRSPFVAQVDRALYAITNPVMGPIRRIIPSIGGLDISPLIVLLLLKALQIFVNSWAQTGNPIGM
jgi:YggT family protein